MAKRSGDLVSNPKARFDYEIIETFEAGIALQGTEVKSLREGGGQLAEAYVRIINNELWLIGAYIDPYRYGNIQNHEERRDRKLLMHRREIVRLKMWIKEKGQALVPLSLYFKEGRIKLKIGRARGKKSFDKRHAIKEREEKRRMDQLKKSR